MPERTLAAMAAQRAIESDRGYTAADLLLRATSLGISPHACPPFGRAVTGVDETANNCG